MKKQYSHNLMSSFYLWFDHRLTATGEAVITGKSQNFRYAQGIDTPVNMYGFYSSDRQFCADHTGAPNFVYITGVQYSQVLTGSNKVIIDHNQGRVLLSNTWGTGVTVSGNFVQKEVNVYITNQSEEEILTSKEFYVASGTGYYESINQIAKARYCMPCVVLTDTDSRNEPFALGGTRDTKTFIKGIVFANSSWQLDGVLSLFRDCSEKKLDIANADNFPYGEYWHVRSAPYRYTGYIATGAIDDAFIERVGVYKISDTKKKIRKDIFMGYMEFDISCIRTV